MILRNGKILLSEINIKQNTENYTYMLQRLDEISKNYYSIYIDDTIIDNMKSLLEKINILQESYLDNTELYKHHKIEEICYELVEWINVYDRKIKNVHKKKIYEKSAVTMFDL